MDPVLPPPRARQPGADPDLATLARVVGDVDAFAARWWGRTPLHRRSAGNFDDLLDVHAVDDFLVSSARRPTFRLVRDGVPIPSGEITMRIRLGGQTVDDVADIARIGALVADGATLVLQGLQRTWPPITRFCRSLERATSHAVQANAYLTPAGASGLGRHADDHDVFVLQIQGDKVWEVEDLGTLELCAGDVLYLPAGTAHACATQRVPSLHLTVGVLRDTFRGTIERALAGVAALDRPLPLGFARPDRFSALRHELGLALEAAAAHLGRAEVNELAVAEAGRAVRRRRPLLSGHLRSLLVSVDDATVVRCRLDNPAFLDGDDLHLADRTVHLPSLALPAVRHLLAAGRAVVGDLPALDAAGRAVLARRLVREGLLEVVDDAPHR